MGVVWVFASISGMITILPDGKIHSINNNFAMMLFGYSQEELEGKVIITGGGGGGVKKNGKFN